MFKNVYNPWHPIPRLGSAIYGNIRIFPGVRNDLMLRFHRTEL